MVGTRDLPTGTVTFLFSDIEGSTRLLKQLGRERYGALLAEHNALLRGAFGSHDGIEIDRQGDAFFFVFRSAGTAVAAAAAAQRAMLANEWPEDGVVRVRIGPITAEVTAASADKLDLTNGGKAVAAFKATGTRILPLTR